MSKGKKWKRGALALALCVVMAMGMTACGSKEAGSKSIAGGEGPHGIKYAKEQVLHLLYGTEATSFHPFNGQGAGDWAALSNCVSGLLVKDPYGNIGPDMAESYDISDDGLVYTFHLRKDMRWTDYKGEDKGAITAHDFVTSAQWICNPDNASGSAYYYEEFIKGAKELLTGEITDMAALGFKAVDDYTLEITLNAPLPYFTAYCGSYIPLPTEYFNQMGDQYGLDNESIYYCGPYLLTTFEPQTQRVYEKNQNYWDKDNVFIEKIVMTYNSEASTIAPEMFKRGEIDYADISTDILDEWMTAEDTKDIVVPGLPDTTYMYYYGFNYNASTSELDSDNNKQGMADEYEPDNWDIAINNENFRQSLYWGIDRYKAKLTDDPYNTEMFLTNSITPRTWCSVDGKDFVDIGDMAAITARANWSFDEAKALEYRDKAIEELTQAGAKFPVILYMPYNPNLASWEKEVQVVKQQLEGLLNTDDFKYIECKIEAGPSTGFLASVRRGARYGFMKLNNGNTIDDPSAWIIAFARDNNWTFMDKVKGEETKALVEQYYAIVDEAKAISSKSMERYEKFAEAEAFLLEHALVIPFSTDTTGYHVTRTNPFEAIYGADQRYKYVKVLAEPLTTEQYDLLYADWKKEQAESLKK